AHSREDAAAALATLTARGARAHALEADVGDPAAVRRMFAEVTETLGGPPDVLVNNAAITEDGLLMMLAEEAWDRVVRTDLTGAALCCRLALRGMIAARWGRIVNVVSAAAFLGQEGASNYAAAKAGLVAPTKRLARLVGRPADIADDTPFFGEGLGLDSIDALELVVLVEERFRVSIPDEEVGKRAFASVDALVDFILQERAE